MSGGTLRPKHCILACSIFLLWLQKSPKTQEMLQMRVISDGRPVILSFSFFFFAAWFTPSIALMKFVRRGARAEQRGQLLIICQLTKVPSLWKQGAGRWRSIGAEGRSPSWETITDLCQNGNFVQRWINPRFNRGSWEEEGGGLVLVLPQHSLVPVSLPSSNSSNVVVSSGISAAL